MKDYLITATDKGGNVKLIVCYTKDLVSEGQKLHNTFPTATAAFGRTLTMSAMMSNTLKNDKDLITIQIKGDGPLKSIDTVMNNKYEVKGYVANPNVDIPLNMHGKLDVRSAIGEGNLTVIKDLGLKNPYNGISKLISGELAEDFTYYFTVSEQIPSSIGLGVLINPDNSVKQAGGFWLTLLPGADDSVVDIVDSNIRNIDAITYLFDNGSTCEDIAGLIFDGLSYTINETAYPKYKCACSRDKISNLIRTLKKEDMYEIVNEDKKIEINCEFCRSKYIFEEKDLDEIFNSGGKNDN